MIDLPSLLLVVGTALVDSINPFSIGVLILIITYLLGNSYSSKHLALFGSVYIFSIWLSYLLVGLGLVAIFANIPTQIMSWVLLGISIFIAIIGALEVKDYFWYGKGVSLQPPRNIVDRTHGLANTKTNSFGLIMLGLFVAIAGLPALGSPLLALSGILRLDFSLSSALLMGLFSLILILPLIIILILAVRKVKISHIARWKEDSKAMIRLFTGILLIFLSWLLMLSANGTINMG